MAKKRKTVGDVVKLSKTGMILRPAVIKTIRDNSGSIDRDTLIEHISIQPEVVALGKNIVVTMGQVLWRMQAAGQIEFSDDGMTISLGKTPDIPFEPYDAEAGEYLKQQRGMANWQPKVSQMNSTTAAKPQNLIGINKPAPIPLPKPPNGLPVEARVDLPAYQKGRGGKAITIERNRVEVDGIFRLEFCFSTGWQTIPLWGNAHIHIGEGAIQLDPDQEQYRGVNRIRVTYMNGRQDMWDDINPHHTVTLAPAERD